MGGEKHTPGRKASREQGSPPHGRGKAPDKPDRTRTAWITPAWAGKSCGRAAPRAQKGDHPRMGGEKHRRETLRKRYKGSPPHGRGKGPRPENTPVLTRITPAWAGKRAALCRYRVYPQDHPRMGGEKDHLSRAAAGGVGSPPHGRGKALSWYGVLPARGITPAWAGKSPFWRA